MPESTTDESPGSVTRLLICGGDATAQQLWGRYVQRLLTLARGELDRVVRARADEDDVVQSAFASFFRRWGDYQLSGRDELWSLLVTFTLNKARNTNQHHLRQKRDARRTQSEARTSMGGEGTPLGPASSRSPTRTSRRRRRPSPWLTSSRRGCAASNRPRIPTWSGSPHEAGRVHQPRDRRGIARFRTLDRTQDRSDPEPLDQGGGGDGTAFRRSRRLRGRPGGSRLAADNPTVAEYQSSLARTHADLGNLLISGGEYDAAATPMRPRWPSVGCSPGPPRLAR